MSNLVSRIITSVILLPVVIACFILGGPALWVLLGVACLLCCAEVAKIIHPHNTRALIIALFICTSLGVPIVLDLGWAFVLAALFMIFLVVNSVVLFSKQLDTRESEKLSAIFFWCLYITFAMLSLFFLISAQDSLDERTGLSFVLLVCMATWGNDTFAYFGGRLFGKHPLFLTVSAKKTWEGFFSGALLSVVAIFLVDTVSTNFGMEVFFGLSTVDMLWVALPACVLAPVGDLMESRLKRFYDAKDSSKILPGHGGLLDRVDGLLLTLPWTALYAFIIRPIW